MEGVAADRRGRSSSRDRHGRAPSLLPRAVEAAPLLLTAFGNTRGFQGYEAPADAMPLLIFNLGTSPYANWQALAWATALLLLVMVLALSVASRLALRRMTIRLRGEA